MSDITNIYGTGVIEGMLKAIEFNTDGADPIDALAMVVIQFAMNGIIVRPETLKKAEKVLTDSIADIKDSQ